MFLQEILDELQAKLFGLGSQVLCQLAKLLALLWRGEAQRERAFSEHRAPGLVRRYDTFVRVVAFRRAELAHVEPLAVDLDPGLPAGMGFGGVLWYSFAWHDMVLAELIGFNHQTRGDHPETVRLSSSIPR